MLFLGTMYVPTADRRGPGQGFTHLPGDVVRIASEKLGSLVNVVGLLDRSAALDLRRARPDALAGCARPLTNGALNG